MSTPPRRKLHARRGAADDNSTTPDAPPFVWASDRVCSPLQHSAHESTPEQLQQTCGYGSTQQQQHRSSSKQDEQQTSNDFKWISDFIHEGTEGQQQQQQQAQQQPYPSDRNHNLQHIPGYTPAAPYYLHEVPSAAVNRRAQTQQRPSSSRRSTATATPAGPVRARPQQQQQQQRQTGSSQLAPAMRAAGAAAGAAGSAAALAGRWLGAAAGTALDRLMGVDPTLITITAAGAGAGGGGGGGAAGGAGVPVSQAAPAAYKPPQQQQPYQQRQHRYGTRQRRAEQQQQAATNTPPRQQQQQQQRESGSGQGGWAVAILLGLLALLSDAATAVTTAYTESLRPGAELLWHLAAALLLYLLLPLLRLLLAGFRLLLRGGGRVMRGANRALGRQLKTAAVADWQQQLGQAPMGRTVSWWSNRGRTDSRSSNSSSVSGIPEQQRLLLLAQAQLDAIACKYPAAAAATAASWDGGVSGCCQLGDFSALCSRMGGLNPERRLHPDSGYGNCSYVAAPALTAAAVAAAGGESTVVQVQLLSDEQEMLRWCAGVEGCLQLQQAAAAGGGAGVEQLLRVSAAAVGLLPAAALTAAAGAGISQSQQQQQGTVLVGVIAVPLLPQPMSLQAHLMKAGVSLSPAAGATAAAGAEAAAPVGRLASLCRSIQLAPQAAAAVGQLCALLLRASEPAATVGAAATGQVQGTSVAELLQGVSACQLAAALVVSNSNSSQGQQAASVQLNPAALLLHTQQQKGEIKLLVSAVEHLLAHVGPATANAAGGVDGGSSSVRGVATRSVRECVGRLTQCLRDTMDVPVHVQPVSTPASAATGTAAAAVAAPDIQHTDAANSTTTSRSSSTDLAAASLVQALSGVLLMLLTGDEGQGALLAPAAAATTTSSSRCCVQPDLALSLQQLQYCRLLEVLRQGAAAELLAAAGPSSSSSRQQHQGRMGPAAAAAAAPPQLRVRLGEASQGVLQQVLGCWEWGAAVRAACDNSSGREPHSAPAPAAPPAGAAATVAPPADAAAVAAAGDGGGSSWMGSLRWLAGRRTAAPAPAAAQLSTSSQPVRPQQSQQHPVQGDVAAAAAAAVAAATFDWPQLLSALQQAGQSAGNCVRMLQQQSCAPPAAYLCPISHEVMSDPVVACDGHTYERRAITEWLQACAGRRAPTKSPMTLLPMQPGLVPNHSLRSLIREWQEQQQQA